MKAYIFSLIGTFVYLKSNLNTCVKQMKSRERLFNFSKVHPKYVCIWCINVNTLSFICNMWTSLDAVITMSWVPLLLISPYPDFSMNTSADVLKLKNLTITMFKCWILLKPVLGSVDGSLHLHVALPSTNRLSQTVTCNILKFCCFELSLELFFQY